MSFLTKWYIHLVFCALVCWSDGKTVKNHGETKNKRAISSIFDGFHSAPNNKEHKYVVHSSALEPQTSETQRLHAHNQRAPSPAPRKLVRKQRMLSRPTSCPSSCPTSWLNDGMCDTSCNSAACDCDGGDCSGCSSSTSSSSQISPTACPSSCPASWLNDGMCDTSCNSAACDCDGGDCSGCSSSTSSSSQTSPTACPSSCPAWWLNDGMCDTSCNSAACDCDGGDCSDCASADGEPSSPPNGMRNNGPCADAEFTGFTSSERDGFLTCNDLREYCEDRTHGEDIREQCKLTCGVCTPCSQVDCYAISSCSDCIYENCCGWCRSSQSGRAECQSASDTTGFPKNPYQCASMDWGYSSCDTALDAAAQFVSLETPHDSSQAPEELRSCNSMLDDRVMDQGCNDVFDSDDCSSMISACVTMTKHTCFPLECRAERHYAFGYLRRYSTGKVGACGSEGIFCRDCTLSGMCERSCGFDCPGGSLLTTDASGEPVWSRREACSCCLRYSHSSCWTGGSFNEHEDCTQSTIGELGVISPSTLAISWSIDPGCRQRTGSRCVQFESYTSHMLFIYDGNTQVRMVDRVNFANQYTWSIEGDCRDMLPYSSQYRIKIVSLSYSDELTSYVYAFSDAFTWGCDPTEYPTHYPSTYPSASPTTYPTSPTTSSPTASPSTSSPSHLPTAQPTASPSTAIPTSSPSTSSPSASPTTLPTGSPSTEPSASPSALPSVQPSTMPSTHRPTALPSVDPTQHPTALVKHEAKALTQRPSDKRAAQYSTNLTVLSGSPAATFSCLVVPLVIIIHARLIY